MTLNSPADVRPSSADVPLSPAPIWLSSALVVVSGLTSALVVFVPGLLRGTAVMNGSARGTALVMLVVAVPCLVAGLVGGRRGSPRATVLWVGTLAYLLYNAVLLLLATPFDRLFLLYAATGALALWSLIFLLVVLDAEALVGPPAPKAARPVAAYMLGVVALNALAWLLPVLRGVLSEGPPAFLEGTGLTTNPIYVQDLVVWLPAMGIAGVLLWRRSSWGHLLAASGLVFWVVEGIGVAVDQWLGHAADPSSDVASAAITPVFLGLAATSGVALWALVRGMPPGPAVAGTRIDGLDTHRRGGWGWSLAVVQTAVGALAVYGGVAMMRDGFGMPLDWLDGTGFDSWTLPGWALLVTVALPQLGVAALVVTGHRCAPIASALAGAALVLWIVVQLAVLQRYFFLQPVIAVLGLVEVGLALGWLGSLGRLGRHRHAPAAGRRASRHDSPR